MWPKRQKKRRNFFRQAQTAPYQARRFKNPYFQQVSSQAKWPFVVIGIAIGLFLALSSFFFTAKIFTINAVRVEGAETINPIDLRTLAEEQLASSVLFFLKQNNRFLFDFDNLKKEIENKYSLLSLEINREGTTLAVIIKEKTSAFLWFTNNQGYLLDNAGTIIRLASDEEIEKLTNPPALSGVTKNGDKLAEENQLMTFLDLSNQAAEIGQTVLSPLEIQNLRTFSETLSAAAITIKIFELNREVGTWFKADTVAGFGILLDPDGDILKQTDNVLTLLNEQITDSAALEYIDVRFGDHVYYK